MVNYKTAKIYRLVNDELGLTYYGSTCNELRKRFWSHKAKAKAKYKECSSYKLFESGECKIYLVEKVPCTDKIELTQRERYYIENNECVNKQIPGRTQKEYNYDNKEQLTKKKKEYQEANKELLAKQRKEHYQENKEQMLKSMKEYRANNKEELKEKQKQYYQANKKIITEKSKEYYQDNKNKKKEHYEANKHIISEKGKIKVNCNCGSVIRKSDFVRHCKTIKHQSFLNTQ